MPDPAPLQPPQPARITVLRDTALSFPDEPIPANLAFEGSVTRIDQPFMELSATMEVAADAALKIETRDALWLGEVEQCTPAGPNWLLRIRLCHVLRDFDTLSRLAERFGTAPGGDRVRG